MKLVVVPMGTVNSIGLEAEAVARLGSMEVETLAVIDVEIGTLAQRGIEEVPAGTVIGMEEVVLGLIAVSEVETIEIVSHTRAVDITIKILMVDSGVSNVVREAI